MRVRGATFMNVFTPWKTGLGFACAVVSLAAGAPKQIDAAKVTCAQYVELGQKSQMRILSFLQGYAHRELPEDKVESVPIGAGLSPLLAACAKAPSAAVSTQVRELGLAGETGTKSDARLTRPPTEITCKSYLKLSREDRRLTVDWLDGYSRKPDPTDTNETMLALDRDPETYANSACGKRKQRLWWAIQGSVRSVGPGPG